MRCEKCGHEAIVLKTVVCRDDGDRRGTLCDPCWLPLRDRLWITVGPVACFGRCTGCSGWFSVNELRDVKPGRKDAWAGLCVDCGKEGG